MQALSQGFKPLNALGTIEEHGSPRGEQVEVGEPAPVDVIDQLPEGVQSLLSDIATDPLERLDLVQDQYEPREPGVLEDQEQSPQEAQGGEVVNVTPDPGHPLD